jgi:hypothetical protein
VKIDGNKSGMCIFGWDHFCGAVSTIKIGQPKEGHKTGIYPGSNGVLCLVVSIGVIGEASYKQKTE